MDTSSHPSVEHQGQLDYNVTGTRIVAALIYFIPLVILFIVMAALSGDSSAEGGSVGVSLSGLPALLFFLLALAYYAVSVGLTGTTLGKRLMGLKVVMLDGRPYGWGPCLGRNLLRVVDGLPVLYEVGLVFIAITRNKRRLGDLAAGTVVVSAVPAPSGSYVE